MPATALPQLETLNLPGLGFRQGCNETHRARIFVRGNHFLYVVLKPLDHQGIADRIRDQYNMRLDDLPALCVIYAYNRAFLHLVVREQRSLHFWSGDIVASGDNHVVRARHESETSVLVLHEGVAGDVPAVLRVNTLTRIV